MKKRLLPLVWISFGLLFSCSEDIPDCPSGLCLAAGHWRLVELYIDGERSDLQADPTHDYQLVLNMPASADAVSADFTRMFPGANHEQGTWSVENRNTLLRLIPFSDPRLAEDWIIELHTPRRLILVINRDTSIKEGPRSIRLVLDSF